jgi:proteasome beta subunit
VTVVLAVKCADGLVMASDSQVTDSARGMSYPAQKLHELGDHAAWGGSGARSVLGDLEKIFDESAAAILESEDVGRELQERVLPVLKHHYEHFIEEIPGEETAGTPSAYVLAAGYARDEPFIVEINPNAMVSRYEDVGFHAIGSGAPMAQQAGALLAHFQVSERSVDYGVLVAVRVIDALAVTSPSVGAEVDVARIGPDGATHLSEREVQKVRKQVERWTDQEQELLDGLFE